MVEEWTSRGAEGQAVSRWRRMSRSVSSNGNPQVSLLSFLKAPWFFADSLFLKSPKRIMALVMVMGLALLVYALVERTGGQNARPYLRTALQERGESVPNQVGKPTQRPTMRRVFQMFEGIDLLVISTPEGIQQQVLNLKPVHRQILRLLGSTVEKCYLDTS